MTLDTTDHHTVRIARASRRTHSTPCERGARARRAPRANVAGVWVRRAAIRPVPTYAQVAPQVVETIEGELSADEDEGESSLDDAFVRFEEKQPALSSHVASALAKPLEETALALGYFLTLAIYLAFERSFGGLVRRIDDESIEAVEQALALDEELRRADPAEAVDSDDVVAMEQPHVVRFVHEHVDAALEAHASTVDVDDVHAVYRLALVEVLALSYAVVPPAHATLPKNEFFA